MRTDPEATKLLRIDGLHHSMSAAPETPASGLAPERQSMTQGQRVLVSESGFKDRGFYRAEVRAGRGLGPRGAAVPCWPGRYGEREPLDPAAHQFREAIGATDRHDRSARYAIAGARRPPGAVESRRDGGGSFAPIGAAPLSLFRRRGSNYRSESGRVSVCGRR